MHPVRSLLLVELCDFPLAHDHARPCLRRRSRRRDEDLPAPLKVRIGQRFLGGHEGELSIAVDTIALAGRQILVPVENSINSSGDARAVAVQRERDREGRNGRDTRASFERRFPKLRHPNADGGNHSKTRDDDSCRHKKSFVASLGCSRGLSTYRKGAPQSMWKPVSSRAIRRCTPVHSLNPRGEPCRRRLSWNLSHRRPNGRKRTACHGYPEV